MYAEEAILVSGWIERYRPDARTILDVARGAGPHARFLSARGYEMHGVDLNDVGDRIVFSTGRRYDAVVCLSSSISHARTLDGLHAALAQFAEHLEDDGVILVEPGTGLFTGDEMTNAFTQADLDVVYDETGISGLGLYVARHRRVC